MESDLQDNMTGVPKRLAIIGSTGSIGTQALDIVRRHPGLYKVVVLTAGTQVDLLAGQCRQFGACAAVIADPALLPRLRDALAGTKTVALAGPRAIAEAAGRDDIDTVLTATVGYSGLEPTLAALRAGHDIALANKETLVVAGRLVNALAAKSKGRIYPVDSEHSAIAQCLRGEDPGSVSRLIITASGGPFRTWDADRIARATAADALHHPNWQMGAKITVDSATMMNKAFEIIEAHYLFGIEPSRITAVVHPQSIVHSMVEFADGAVKAQLGVPDMRLPIAYALGCNSRLRGVSPSLTLAQLASLTFEEPDTQRFRCLTLARTALERGGDTACVINAANEVANLAFRQGRITFGRIYRIIEKTLDKAGFVAEPDYGDYVASNDRARAIAAEMI